MEVCCDLFYARSVWISLCLHHYWDLSFILLRGFLANFDIYTNLEINKCNLMSTRRTLLANFFEIALDRYCTIQISRKKKRCFFEYKFCVISNWQVEDLNNNTEAIKQTVRHFPKIFNEQMYVLTSRKRFLYLQLILVSLLFCRMQINHS